MALTQQDKDDIVELVARYNWHIDHWEAEEWADLFTEDGVLIAGGTERCRGRAARTEYVAVRRRTGKPKIRHWAGNFIIDGDGATARLRCYVKAYLIDDGLGAPYVMGEYDDTLTKIDGKWKFVERRMTTAAGGSATANLATKG